MVSEDPVEITVMLPRGEVQLVAVSPSTPVMDLLVRLATTNHLNPSDHVIRQVANDRTRRFVRPPLPSAHVGSLGTTTIELVPKDRKQPGSRQSCQTGGDRNSSLPDLRTRVRVFMPCNQLHVVRVMSTAPLQGLLQQVCREKSLNPDSYQLIHPVDRTEILSLSRNLLDYNIRDVALQHVKSSQSTVDGCRKESKPEGTPIYFTRHFKGMQICEPCSLNTTKTEGSHSFSSDSLCDNSIHSEDSVEFTVGLKSGSSLGPASYDWSTPSPRPPSGSVGARDGGCSAGGQKTAIRENITQKRCAPVPPSPVHRVEENSWSGTESNLQPSTLNGDQPRLAPTESTFNANGSVQLPSNPKVEGSNPRRRKKRTAPPPPSDTPADNFIVSQQN